MIMKKIFYLILSLILFAGCFSDSDVEGDDSKKPNVSKDVTLELSVSDIVFEATGGKKTFMVSCSGDWTIENGDDWCETDFCSGMGNSTVTVMTDKYSGMEDRNTNLTVKAGDKTEVLGVTQKGKNAIILSKDKFEVEQEGERISIEIKSNITYEVTIPEEFQSWIISSPNTRAVTTRSYDFTISKNEKNQSRSGYIVFSGNSLSDTVWVYQSEFKEQLILMEDSYELSMEGGIIIVELRTNIDYEIYIPETILWVTQLKNRSSRTDKILFLVEKNESGYNRNAVISINAKNSVLSDTLYINQYAQKTDTGECFDAEIALFMEDGLVPDTDPTSKIDGWYCRGQQIVLRAVLSSPEGYDIENGHYKWTIDGLKLSEEHFELETDTCVLKWIPEFQEEDIVVKVCGYCDGACDEVCSQYVRLKAYDWDTKPKIVSHSQNPRNIAPGKDVYFAVRAMGVAPLSYEWYRKVNGAWSLLVDNSFSFPAVRGATTDSLILESVPKSWDASELKVVVKNNYDTASIVFQLGVKGCFDITADLIMDEGIIPDTDPTNKIDGWYCRGQKIALRAVLSSPEGYDIENGHYKWTIDGLEFSEGNFESESDTCVLTWIPEFQEEDIMVKVCGYCDEACEEVCSRYVRLKAYDLMIVSHSKNPRNIAPGKDVYFAVRAMGVAPLSYEWYRKVNGAWSLLVDDSFSFPAVRGATTDSLILESVPESWDGSYLKVVVNNDYDMVSMIFQLGVK